MPRPEKVAAVADIKERIEGSQAVFVTEFRGMTVKQLGVLRRSLRASGADYKVVKMTLARLATDELGIEDMRPHLLGPSALTFAKTDPVATAKVLRDAGKENEKFVIKAGILSGKVIRPEQVTALADIEPREILLSKIAGAAKAPLVKTAGLMASFTRNAATMFAQLLEKKEASSAPAAAVEPVAEVPVAEVPVAEVPVVQAPAGDAAETPEADTDTTPDESAETAEEE